MNHGEIMILEKLGGGYTVKPPYSAISDSFENKISETKMLISKSKKNVSHLFFQTVFSFVSFFSFLIAFSSFFSSFFQLLFQLLFPQLSKREECSTQTENRACSNINSVTLNN